MDEQRHLGSGQMFSWPPTELSSENVEVFGDVKKWAVLSRCGKYRFMLGRAWDEPDSAQDTDTGFGKWKRPLCVWLMLNPSTADHSQDDPTIRKCVGFSQRLGCGGLIVVNLFAWRATDPDDLAEAITDAWLSQAPPALANDFLRSK